ncbi:hypothetical protein [Nostoc sp.]
MHIILYGNALTLHRYALALYGNALTLHRYALALYGNALTLHRYALALYGNALTLQGIAKFNSLQIMKYCTKLRLSSELFFKVSIREGTSHIPAHRQ